ncbi:MAG: hypothetical protein V3S79_02215 [Candidatus Thermoplasmatota archaeon]|nr:hypothetical protein [Thermoplasmatales archaeon]
MGKNIDLIQILTLVIVAMFIPFLISIIINYRLDLSNMGDLIKIFSTFGLFLLFFGIELIIVYLYFNITNLLAKKKMNNQKEK